MVYRIYQLLKRTVAQIQIWAFSTFAIDLRISVKLTHKPRPRTTPKSRSRIPHDNCDLQMVRHIDIDAYCRSNQPNCYKVKGTLSLESSRSELISVTIGKTYLS
jgi:hypothetical protein